MPRPRPGRIHSPRFLVPFPSGDKDPPPAAAKSVPSPATSQPQPINTDGRRRKQVRFPLSGPTKDSSFRFGRCRPQFRLGSGWGCPATRWCKSGTRTPPATPPSSPSAAPTRPASAATSAGPSSSSASTSSREVRPVAPPCQNSSFYSYYYYSTLPTERPLLVADMSTDGRWCYIVLWVAARRGRRPTAWGLLKERLVELCPVAAPYGIDSSYLLAAGLEDAAVPRFFLLKFCCFDRMGLLHDVTRVLCEMELTIRRVKVSTTPDGRVMDLFFITDARELLHTKKRREEAYEKLQSVLGDSVTSFEIDSATQDMISCLQASALLPPLVLDRMFNIDLIEDQLSSSRSNSTSVTTDNSLSPVHTLIQIQCIDHKGLLYDVMRTLKDCNIQISYGRFYAGQKGRCELDLFAVQSDGKKIIDQQKQRTLCSRLKIELLRPLRVALVNRGPDMELLVANPVEVSGKGRPLVFYDITLALKNLHKRVFL
ncbi:unnamed protein product [Alopecurus aequalis]